MTFRSVKNFPRLFSVLGLSPTVRLEKCTQCNILAQRKFAIWHAYTTENSASFEIWNTAVAFVDRVLCVIASAYKMMLLPVGPWPTENKRGKFLIELLKST